MAHADLMLNRHKIDVHAYERMAEVGILGEADRVELIDGEIIDMAPIGEPHSAFVSRITRALVFSCGEKAIVSTQSPVRLDRRNMPQPDFAVLRPRADFYESARPGSEDILLLVEVSDSSLQFDRTVKLPLYARAGIGEFWIVDLKRRLVDVHRIPSGDRYQDVQTCGPGDMLTLALEPEISVAADRLLG